LINSDLSASLPTMGDCSSAFWVFWSFTIAFHLATRARVLSRVGASKSYAFRAELTVLPILLFFMRFQSIGTASRRVTITPKSSWYSGAARPSSYISYLMSLAHWLRTVTPPFETNWSKHSCRVAWAATNDSKP